MILSEDERDKRISNFLDRKFAQHNMNSRDSVIDDDDIHRVNSGFERLV